MRVWPVPAKPPVENSRVQIGLVEPEEIEAQHGRRGTFPHPERIEIRDLMPAEAIDLDQAGNGRLLLDRGRGFGARCRRRTVRAALPQALRYGLDDGPCGISALLGARVPKYWRHSGGTLPGSARYCS